MQKEEEKKRETILLSMTNVQKELCINFCNLANSITKLYPEEFYDDVDSFFDTAWAIYENRKEDKRINAYYDYRKKGYSDKEAKDKAKQYEINPDTGDYRYMDKE